MRDLGMLRRTGIWFWAVVLGMVLPVYGQYGPGTGEPNNPYQIWMPQQMNAIGANPGDWGKCFKLMADIDMSIYTGTQYKIIGNYTTKFTGTFDGNGHIISNLTYTTTAATDYVSLFGYIENATIKNLGVKNVCLSTGNDRIGGLVGRNYYGAIIDCYVTGSVSGESNVGGLVGLNNGSITGCYTKGTVNGRYAVGGLVGENEFGTITYCYATSQVSETGTSDFYIGGLIGYNNNSTITSCFWDVQTSEQTGSSGGKGLTTEQMKTLSIYQNAGWADQGWVMEDGVDYPRLSWEGTSGVPIPSPQSISLAGSGTTEEPYLISTADEFALLSWYSGILDKQIRMTANLDLSGVDLYPIGDLGPFTGMFDGNEHTISNAVIHRPGSDYVGLFGMVGTGGQICDLNLNNIQINGYDYVGGLVGWNQSGMITGCYAIGAVSGTDKIGGLIGYNNDGAMIINCYGTGSVSGTRSIGGLVGYNYSGNITNCYGTGSVSVESWGYSIGGLVGTNFLGMITNCYAIGSVSGTKTVGGLVGDNQYGTLSNCHATSQVSETGTGDLYSYFGGLIGSSYEGMIIDCYATGSVSGTGEYVGGLIGGKSYGTITGCCASCSVNGTDYVGGLVGSNDGDTINGCYATGSVSGNYAVGGLVGHNTLCTITKCYTNGLVSGTGIDIGGLVGSNYKGIIKECFTIDLVSGLNYIGGLVGYQNGSSSKIENCYSIGQVSASGSDAGGFLGYLYAGTVTGCFWDKENSGMVDGVGNQEPDPSGVVGLDTAEMMTLGTFTGAGWDFTEGDGDGADWMMVREGEDYPRLAWQEVYGGDIAGLYGVGLEDLLEVAGNWLEEGCPAGCEEADINGDGRVDLEDLAVVAGEWLKS